MQVFISDQQTYKASVGSRSLLAKLPKNSCAYHYVRAIIDYAFQRGTKQTYSISACHWSNEVSFGNNMEGLVGSLSSTIHCLRKEGIFHRGLPLTVRELIANAKSATDFSDKREVLQSGFVKAESQGNQMLPQRLIYALLNEENFQFNTLAPNSHQHWMLNNFADLPFMQHISLNLEEQDLIQSSTFQTRKNSSRSHLLPSKRATR